MHKLKTLFAAACAFVACSAFAWTPGLEGGTVSAAPGSDAGKTSMPTTTAVYLHPEAASSTTSPGDTVYVYSGRIYLDGTYAFGSFFDDSVQLKIDGELVIGIYNDWNTYKTATITKSAGWYDIDVRVGNTGWGMGPCDGAKVKNPATEELESCGFGYKKLEAGETPPTENSGASMNFYYRLVDDGTGSFLRCNKDGRGYGDEFYVMSSTGMRYGDVTPAYGMTNGLAVGDTIACSATAVEKGVTLAGWKLYTNAVESSELLLWREGTESSFTYTHGDCAAYLVWQWEEENPPPPATWTYDAATKVITTVSGWEFNTDGNVAGLTITSLKTVGTSGTLDFSGTPVLGTPAIVAFGREIFFSDATGRGRTGCDKPEELILPDTVHTIGHCAFRSCSNLKTVRLSANIQDVGDCGFMDCTKLTTVTPFLPDTLTTINATFYNCSSLTGELVIASKNVTDIDVNFSGGNYYGAFYNTRITLADLSKSSVTNIHPFSFRSSNKLKRVKLPKTLEWIGDAAFYQCSSLNDVNFQSYPPVYGSSIFAETKTQSGGGRITYPADNVSWVAFVASLNPTLWANAGSDRQKTYLATHADGLIPVGFANYKPEGGINSFTYTKWFVPVPVETTDTRLAIKGTPVQCGEVTPAYGDCGVIETFPVVCSASQYALYEGTLYECQGYRLGKLVGTDIEYGELVSARTMNFNPEEVGSYSLQWEWKVVAYPITLKAGTGVTITIDEDPYEGYPGYYAAGKPVTVRAAGPKSELPARWYIDGTAGHDGETTLSVTVSKAMTILTYVPMDWTYANGTLTDGYWTFNASGDADAITIGALMGRAADVDILDFRKTVHAGETTGAFVAMADSSCKTSVASTIRDVYFAETVTSIGAHAFQDVKSIKYVKLPEALQSIGREAFRDSGVQTVTPFLPANVTLGIGAFYGAGSLTGALVLKTTQPAILPGEGEIGVFFGTRITSADLSKSKITSVGKNCFRECPNIGEVFFPKSLNEIVSAAFWSSGNLTNLVFRSYPTESFLRDTFGDDTSYKRRIVYPAGNAGWAQYIADRSSSFVAWENTTAGEKNEYTARYGTKPLPIGYLIHFQGQQFGNTRFWMVPQNEGSFSIIIR